MNMMNVGMPFEMTPPSAAGRAPLAGRSPTVGLGTAFSRDASQSSSAPEFDFASLIEQSKSTEEPVALSGTRDSSPIGELSSANTPTITSNDRPEQKVLKEFLESLEKKVGVTPEAWIGAFGKLQPQEWQMSPRDSLPRVVESLELDSEKKEQAESLVAQMLSAYPLRIEEGPDDQISTSLHTQNSPYASLEQATTGSLREQSLSTNLREQNSLKSLDEQSFLNNLREQPAVTGIPDKLSIRGPETKTLQSTVQEQPANSILANQTLVATAQELPAASLVAQQSGPVSLHSERTKENHLKFEKPSSAAKYSENVSASQASQTEPLSLLTSLRNVAGQSLSQGNSEYNKQDLDYKQRSLENDGSSSPEGSSMTDGALSPEMSLSVDSFSLASTAPGSTVPGANVFNSPTSSSGTEIWARNSQEIISGAQTLIREKGGEVRVKLHPEGLGEVQLKVLLENGRVNVEMLAESVEARKMIESNLPDLKNNLSAQNIQVDLLKVDDLARSSSDSQTQSHSQSHSNSHSQSQSYSESRNQGVFDYSQSQQQHQSRRQVYDAPEIQTIRPNLERFKNSPVSASSRLDSRRLNLVA